MRKCDEMSSPDSCLNKANFDEMLFVLLGRDRAAGATIRFWADLRVLMGLNKPDDYQIKCANECAAEMDRQSGVR